MFIGPFTVYLGGLMGPWRILLTAAALFTVLLIFLPLMHSYSLVIALTLLAGLTSGTFYPLTLTFALRNIPLRYLPLTIALYATFVDGAVNIAFALRLVQRPSFFELDVLEFGAHHAPDDGLYLLRDTQEQLGEEIRECTELRRIFVCQLGPRYVADRLRTG
jgi:hypothetical protein